MRDSTSAFTKEELRAVRRTVWAEQNGVGTEETEDDDDDDEEVQPLSLTKTPSTSRYTYSFPKEAKAWLMSTVDKRRACSSDGTVPKGGWDLVVKSLQQALPVCLHQRGVDKCPQGIRKKAKRSA